MCECILSCDKLQYQLEDFWVECFTLIKRIIGGVDYKGVREIMKVGFPINSCNDLFRFYLICMHIVILFAILPLNSKGIPTFKCFIFRDAKKKLRPYQPD